MDDKFAVVTEKLLKRETERLTEVQRRNEEKDTSKSIQENVKIFNDTFNKEKIAIENEIDSCKLEKKSDAISKLDLLSKEVQKLQKYFADSTIFLPGYEIKQATESISDLQQKIQDKRDEVNPKKKFAFKSKKKEQATSKPLSMSNETKEATKIDQETINKAQVILADCKFVDRHNTELMKAGEEILQKDVSLARLTDCTVKLFGAPSTVHMKELKNCTVLCGPVSSSVFVSDCQNCTFVLACQQLRTHSTVHSTFYLHVTSRAIIEDCSNIYFAPYNLDYDELDSHFKTSGLDKTKNNWQCIDDFNWLASDAHSPNWSVLPEEQRKEKFNYTNII